MSAATFQMPQVLRPVPQTAGAPDASALSGELAQRLRKTGKKIVLFAVLPIAAWMAFAPLSMAVVAPAFVKVDLNRRPVQHLEGGIVRQVLVRDGQRVKAGEPMVLLGDVGVDADRSRVRFRADVERATVLRLEAEQGLEGELKFSPELLESAKREPRVAQALRKERSLFEARRNALRTETALLRRQRERLEAEITALNAEIAQTQASVGIQQKDLERSRGLVADGFISATRLGQVETSASDYAARLEEKRGELARAQQRAIDIEIKLSSGQSNYVQQASDQLKSAAARLSELEQEMRKSEDAASRQAVVAPADGEVIELKFTSPGAVIRPGEAIAEVVPSSAPLIIEAHVRTEEVNHVYPGQHARIKLSSFKYRNLRMLEGKVKHVSGDRLIDKATGAPYFHVLIETSPESLAEVGGDLKLQAGMPVEVYIEGTAQTALEYLLEPIRSTMRRAARQI